MGKALDLFTAIDGLTPLSPAEEFIQDVHDQLKTIERSFFTVGYLLNEAERKGYYRELGYSDIYELADKEFGIGKTTTKNLKLVNMQFSERGPNANKLYIQEKYKDFNQSQLVEMASMGPSHIECITPDMTRDDIRALKKVYELCYTPESKEVFQQNFTLEPAQVTAHPLMYVKRYREWKEQGGSPKKKKEDVTEKPVDGQMYLADDGTVTEYYQSSIDEIVGQPADRKEMARKQLDEILKDADDNDNIGQVINGKATLTVVDEPTKAKDVLSYSVMRKLFSDRTTFKRRLAQELCKYYNHDGYEIRCYNKKQNTEIFFGALSGLVFDAVKIMIAKDSEQGAK